MGCGTSVVTESQAKKSEKAIKAAILIQRWYRCYTARLEMRRRYTLSIFQSIEYAEEQDQLQLSNFFTFMLDHFTQLNGSGPDLISHLFNASGDRRGSIDGCKSMEYEKVQVPDSYDGPRLSFPLTITDTNALLHAFKNQQILHVRYVLQLLHETKKYIKQLPNIVHLSTSYSKEITICGDLHGKLDDLLLIFYKNGLPSADNPYLFNGDFVDRGKNSIEILMILFAFLLVYPNNLHLNRGNHEDHIMNLRYGFTNELMEKYKSHGRKILHHLQDIYSWLPLATVIDNKVLVLHGGISDATDLDFLASLERNKFRTALRPPKSRAGSSQSNNRTGQRAEESPPVTEHAGGLPAGTVDNGTKKHTTDTGHGGTNPKEVESVERKESVAFFHAGYRGSPTLELPFLDSSAQLSAPLTPELTALEQEEWKQVIDVLWSDPRNQMGCSPNSFRGGGCYFGPDVTTKILNKYNLKMLIRSHECKQDGYEICHDGKVVTIFSASNYYEEGSNRGAYLKLGPDLVPRFVQYQVSKSTRKLTLQQRLSVAEGSALRSLREKLYAHKSELLAAFRKHDEKEAGATIFGRDSMQIQDRPGDHI
ncbi:serine/threonine-protein phosphatase with EF-hands 1 isoform X2 [Ambystoma mexicanum]|uniref:serine/threonine-protein phosphatase with EF-hands 1 isoform X2 n=1 Tax=Ambystoma mexicanum TaxID=8296 RepID=UPI0037E94C19